MSSKHTRPRSRSGKSGPSGGAGSKATSAGRRTQGTLGPLYSGGTNFSLGSSPVQRKLVVGKSDDTYEREADAVADRVVSGQPTPTISKVPASGLGAAAQRGSGDEEELAQTRAVQRQEGAAEEEEELQASPVQRQEEEEEELQTSVQRQEEEEEELQTLVQRQEEEEEELQTSVQRQEEEEEEEELQTLVQRQDEEEEELQTSVQRQAEEEEEELQTLVQRQDEEEEEAIQAKSEDSGGMSEAAEQAVHANGAGTPLHPTVRNRLERGMGADLGDVRVHRDDRSQRAARDLRARAFTHGKDIWLGKGESPRDTRLMAHEAAHVVQQTGRAQRKVVQRVDDGSTDTDVLTSVAGTINLRTKKMSIPEVSLPSQANKQNVDTSNLKASSPGRSQGDQRDMWREQISGAGLDTKVDQKLTDDKAIPSPAGEKVFYLKVPNEQNYFIVGTRPVVKEQVRLPNWTAGGRREYFQVDHVHELQLGGAHGIDNFQLLDDETNRNAGNAIRQEIRGRINDVVAPHVGEGKNWAAQPNSDSLRAEFEEIKFEAKSSDPLTITGRQNHWTKAQVADQGAHLDVLQVLTAAEIEQQGVPLVGDETKLVLFMAESAGRPKEIPWGPDGPRGLQESIWPTGFDVTGISYTPGQGGSVTGEVYNRNRAVHGGSLSVPIEEVGGLQYTGRLQSRAIRQQMSTLLRGKGASPIVIDDAFFSDTSVVARGVLKPSPKLLKRDLEIDLTIDGEDVTLSKTFTADEFEFPGPIDVTAASLTLSVGTRGLELQGDVAFEIERVGQGTISGMGSIAEGFAVEGEFEFDPTLFNEAEAKISVRYAQDELSGGGTIKIGEGTVRGIKSAELTVEVQGETWTAGGTVEPNVPGIKEGNLEATFQEDGGFEITGRLEFSNEIPRVKGGHLQATVTREDDRYFVEGEGSAELDIPGVDASVSAQYRDGEFQAEATVGYERGIASGTITAGVTNRPVDEEGRPGGEPGDDLSVYGQGSVTIQFTPWLEGTAGIRLSPDGQLEVTGRVALPDSVEVFPEKKVEKELLSVGVDIPIFGVAVAGQRIGIFLNISGSLSARAVIGPGELRDVAVEVTYNPEDPSSAQITGTGRFVIPADAGLRLAISGSIGAGIPIVSAQAGLEIGGELGVAGEAAASAQIEWTPQTGIDLEAEVSLIAQPKFTFDITGFVEVTADLVLTEVELYSKRWQLAAVEFGSGMQVGARMPVRVAGGEFQDLSVNDIEFIVPEVDPLDIARNLIEQIA